MLTLRVTGLVLAGGLWMSGVCLADEASVRAYLSSTESTVYLQQGDARLELLNPETRAPSDAYVFQKFIGNLPLHGARVVVVIQTLQMPFDLEQKINSQCVRWRPVQLRNDDTVIKVLFDPAPAIKFCHVFLDCSGCLKR